MNVFVLCTGRCGSTTFYNACKHITNYTVGHESNVTKRHYVERMLYESDHIEIDCRFSWMLGQLEKYWGSNKYVRYVHLTRNKRDVVKSFYKNFNSPMMDAFRFGILQHSREWSEPDERRKFTICEHHYEMMMQNIEAFLQDKGPITIDIDKPVTDFKLFWEEIGAEGNLEEALLTLKHRYHVTK